MNLMSVREFEKRLEYCYVNFTVDDYKAYISYMAERVSTSGRADFIARLEGILNIRDAANLAVPNGGVCNTEQDTSPGERATVLLEQIDALEEAFDDLVENYENGDYDYEDYYNDELSFDEFSGYDDLRDECNDILLDARDLFSEGYYKEARAVYAGVTRFMREGSRGYSLFCLRETNAGIDYSVEMSRYLCCIYFTERLENRPMPIYDFFDKGTFICEYINIKKVALCSSEEMPDFHNFLLLWKNYLLSQPITENTSYLIREAAEIHGGIEEIKALAINYGDLYPEAYFDWIMMLRNKSEDITESCLYALDRVTEVKTGLKLCSYLAEQAEKNNDIQNCMIAWEKAFCYDRVLPNLLNMLKYAKTLQCQEEKLKYALKQVKSMNRSNEIVEMHILIFLKDLKSAYGMCREGKALGWSYGSTHIPVFAGFLMKQLSVGKNCTLKHINNFWNMYTDAFNKHPEYSRCVTEAIEAIIISEHEKDTYYQWCVKICCDRIDGIVSGQHRNAYYRAAQTLAACEELRTNLYGRNDGESLVKRYSNKYPRHIKFIGSIRKILGSGGW